LSPEDPKRMLIPSRIIYHAHIALDFTKKKTSQDIEKAPANSEDPP
jgi:hypothetical protein